MWCIVLPASSRPRSHFHKRWLLSYEALAAQGFPCWAEFTEGVPMCSFAQCRQQSEVSRTATIGFAGNAMHTHCCGIVLVCPYTGRGAYPGFWPWPLIPSSCIGSWLLVRRKAVGSRKLNWIQEFHSLHFAMRQSHQFRSSPVSIHGSTQLKLSQWIRNESNLYPASQWMEWLQYLIQIEIWLTAWIDSPCSSRSWVEFGLNHFNDSQMSHQIYRMWQTAHRLAVIGNITNC